MSQTTLLPGPFQSEGGGLRGGTPLDLGLDGRGVDGLDDTARWPGVQHNWIGRPSTSGMTRLEVRAETATVSVRVTVAFIGGDYPDLLGHIPVSVGK